MHLFFFSSAIDIKEFPGEKMDLTLELKDMMEKHFEKFPNVSINAFAMRSNVGATTLRRILSSSIKGEPSPHTILSIASVLYKEKKLSKLLPMVEGKVGEFLRKNFAQFMEEDVPHTFDLNLNEVLAERLNYLIYKLAANRVGTTRDKILELFGKLGEERLETLIKMGLILEEGEKLHAKEKNFSLDPGLSKKHLPDLVNFYKPQELSEGKNIFYTLSESINEEGVKKIKEIQYEAVRKIFEVMSAKDYEGDIPYFTINLSDTMELSSFKGVLQ